MNQLKLSFKLQSPFMTGNAETPDLTLDALLPRDVNKRLVFPGSLMRGVMLDSLTTMADLSAAQSSGLLGMSQQETKALLRNIFGAKSYAEDPSDVNIGDEARDRFSPKRRGVQFGNLTSIEAYPSGEQSFKIRIERDDVSGSAKEGQMQRIEMIGAHGTLVDFEMVLTLQHDMDSDLVKDLLDLAMRPIAAIGSAKSAGFGKIFDYSSDKAPVQSCPQLTCAGGDLITIRMAVHGALSIDNRRLGTNAFVSDTIIPGGAIKAAIADAMGDMETQSKALLSKMRISHAFPVLEGSKPHQVLPLSVGYFKDTDGVFDAIGFVGPVLQPTANALEVPSFAVDWKDEGKVLSLVDGAIDGAAPNFTPVKVKRQNFVRTAIDYASGSAKIDDEGGQLFVNECVLPVSGDNKKVEWEFTVHSDDMDAALAMLNSVNMHGMHLGKLSTPVELISVVQKNETAITPFMALDDDYDAYALVLQSDALMFLGSEVRGRALHDVYSAYFQTVFLDAGFSGLLTLEKFFAEQELRGGYQALRFMGGRKHYEPWVLTKAGSVFLIKVDRQHSVPFAEILHSLRKSGLPAQAGAHALDWTNCPFVAENGYGAFNVNPLPAGWTSSNLQNLYVVQGIVEDAHVS